MKRTLAALLLLPLFFSACRDPSVDTALLGKADDAAKVPALPHDAAEYTGDWEPETVYSPGDFRDIEGMRYVHAPLANAAEDGLWFFKVCTTRQYEKEGGIGTGTAWLQKVVDLETGEDRPLCPDPLCRHIQDECPYVNLNPFAYADGSLYVRRGQLTQTGEGDAAKGFLIWTIERIDPMTGEFTVLAREGDKTPLTEGSVMVTNVGIEDGLLRYQRITERTGRENKTESRTRTLVLRQTGKIVQEIPVPQELTDADFSVLMADGDGFLCSDAVNGLYRTDGQLQNRKTIVDAVECERVGLNAVDSVTGEIFVDLYNPITAEEMSSFRTQTKRLGRLVGDKVEAIPLPRDDLIEVCVTRSWIYYTAADFVSVGPGTHGEAGFEDGGVIYRVPRDDPSAEPEIIFSDGVSFDMKEWFILGDWLYLGSWQRTNEGGLISFGRTVKGVRLNLKDHTVRYFRYD